MPLNPTVQPDASDEETGREGPADPFPFHRDGWFSKALVVAFVVLPLAALAYAVVSLWGSHIGALELGLLLGFWTFTGLGISVGFHRMLTHRSLELRAPARAVLLVAGSMAMQGPPADWAATHIRHHAKADREGDPHSPLEGFWHAHLGWLLRDRFVRSGLAYDKLLADPVTRFVTRTWWVWATLGLLLPALVGFLVEGTLWGAVDGLVWGGLVRVFFGHHITWSVNSLGHCFGTRPFEIQDQARNNWFVALLGWGEGWHNNHHAFPRAAYIGMRWWQIDIGAWLIHALRWLGQVRKVVQPTREEKRARSRRWLRRMARSVA